MLSQTSGTSQFVRTPAQDPESRPANLHTKGKDQNDRQDRDTASTTERVMMFICDNDRSHDSNPASYTCPIRHFHFRLRHRLTACQPDYRQGVLFTSFRGSLDGEWN